MTAPLAYTCIVCGGVRALPPAVEVQCLATGCGRFVRACATCCGALDQAFLDESTVRRRLLELHAGGGHAAQPLNDNVTPEAPMRL